MTPSTRDANDEPGILLGKEALGDDHVEIEGERDRHHGHGESDAPVAQHPPQAHLVGCQHAGEEALACRIQATLALASAIAQELGAHHRGERQRNDRGHQDRGADGDRELAKQAADQATHQQHWDENGDQRDAHGDDGEADLPRALERSLDRRIALFEIARDVLDHNNRVVDHEAGGDGQPHQ